MNVLRRLWRRLLGVTEFDLDWTSPPGDTLREIRTERGASIALMAAACLMEQDFYWRVEEGLEVINPVTAGLLERGTGVSAEFWYQREVNYRDDLAAGKAVYRAG